MWAKWLLWVIGSSIPVSGFSRIIYFIPDNYSPTQKQRYREISDQVTLLVRKEPELKSITSDSKAHDLYTRDSIRGEQRPVEFSGINGIRKV